MMIYFHLHPALMHGWMTHMILELITNHKEGEEREGVATAMRVQMFQGKECAVHEPDRFVEVALAAAAAFPAAVGRTEVKTVRNRTEVYMKC